ncbi:MAG: hypothetical protein ACLRTQ_11295 [Candidatus Borkfalkia sp.]
MNIRAILPEVICNPQKQYDGFEAPCAMLLCGKFGILYQRRKLFWYDDLLKKREGQGGSLKNVGLISVRAVGDASGDLLPARSIQGSAAGRKFCIDLGFGKSRERGLQCGEHAHLLRFIKYGLYGSLWRRLP